MAISATANENPLASIPHSQGTMPPKTAVPEDATDCHHHIFDPRFPRISGRTGVWATVDDYRLLQQRLGLSKSIVVCPGSYGFDNRALLDALAQLGENARGVAAVQPDVSDETLRSLHVAGVRGIRLYLEGPLRRTPVEIKYFAERIAPLGWHIQILPDLNGQALEDCEQVLSDIPCQIVLDHLAYIPQPFGTQHARMQTVRRLLQLGKTWVKLSGVYITSKIGYPNYEDVDAVASELAHCAPNRVLWGSDWPHTLVSNMKPDGALLVDQLERWVPDAQARNKILVDNPNTLYWNS